VSTTTLPPTAPPDTDVLRPRPRGTLRREIVAVIFPAWSEPGADVTSYRRAPGSVAEQAAPAR